MTTEAHCWHAIGGGQEEERPCNAQDRLTQRIILLRMPVAPPMRNLQVNKHTGSRGQQTRGQASDEMRHLGQGVQVPAGLSKARVALGLFGHLWGKREGRLGLIEVSVLQTWVHEPTFIILIVYTLNTY